MTLARFDGVKAWASAQTAAERLTKQAGYPERAAAFQRPLPAG